MVVVDLRTGVLDIPSQDILTSDSIAVSVDAILYYRVRDPLQAVVGNDNYVTATEFKVLVVGPSVSRRRRPSGGAWGPGPCRASCTTGTR